MTPAQYKFLQSIDALAKQMHPITPDYREIADACGYESLNSVHKMFVILKRKELVKFTPACARDWKITPKGKVLLVDTLAADQDRGR